MTKVAGYSRDAYTSKTSFLDDGESPVRQTTSTTGSSVWESPMIAKSEKAFERGFFSSRSQCPFTYNFLNEYYPILTSPVVRKVRPF